MVEIIVKGTHNLNTHLASCFLRYHFRTRERNLGTTALDSKGRCEWLSQSHSELTADLGLEHQCPDCLATPFALNQGFSTLAAWQNPLHSFKKGQWVVGGRRALQRYWLNCYRFGPCVNWCSIHSVFIKKQTLWKNNVLQVLAVKINCPVKVSCHEFTAPLCRGFTRGNMEFFWAPRVPTQFPLDLLKNSPDTITTGSCWGSCKILCLVERSSWITCQKNFRVDF